MRIENTDLISTGVIGTSMGANLTSNAIKIDHIAMLSLSLAWTDTPTGDLKIQVSNYAGPLSAPTYWDDLSPSAAAIAAGLLNGSSSVTYIISDTAFKWYRIVYTRTSGTGTLTVADMMLKGV